MTELLSRIFIKDHKEYSNPKVRKAYGALSSFVGIFVNLLLSVIKLILGFLTKSAAITADAINNLSDAGSSIITLVSFKMSSKPADRDHPFGHARIEYIASMIVSFLILLVGFETMMDAIRSIFDSSKINTTEFSTVSLIILSLSIIFKMWLAIFYRTVGKKIESNVIMASGIDSLTDSISTIAVLVSAIIIKFTDYQIIDAIMSLAVSLLIIVAGVRILNETKNSLLGEAPVDEQIEMINKIVSEYPDIIDTHDLIIHNYGPNHYITSMHAEVDGAQDIFKLHDMIDNVERRIQDELNMLCTIHMDPIVTNDETVNELKKFLIDVVHEEVDPQITIHDFRVVIGETHTNMIFDILLPFENTTAPNDVISKISEAVLSRRENCYCVITVDRG